MDTIVWDDKGWYEDKSSLTQHRYGNIGPVRVKLSFFTGRPFTKPLFVVTLFMEGCDPAYLTVKRDIPYGDGYVAEMEKEAESWVSCRTEGDLTDIVSRSQHLGH